MYNRLIYIQNKFNELREILFNRKVIGKLLCVMLRRSRWKSYVSTLETMQEVQVIFILDEIYSHLMSDNKLLPISMYGCI
jgi:hypothetical protein